MKRCLFLVTIMSFLFFNCSNLDSKKYGYSIAHVDSTKRIHWGKGFYKLRVFYSFKIDTINVESVYDHKLGRSYSARFAVGDSVFIKYDKDVPEKSEIIKVVYKKQKIKL